MDFSPETTPLRSVGEGIVSSLTPTKKLTARQLVFTEFGLAPAEDCFNFQNARSKSPGSVPLVSSMDSQGRKPCHCVRSKCLKLYCECFASGAYCDGCSCTDCQNNVENEAVRRAATASVLERKPYAFRPKIATCPCRIQVTGEYNRRVPVMGKHDRGCNCKRTKCLKKYCECFRANIICSEKCKCVGCKNVDLHKQILAESCADCGEVKAYFKQTNIAMSTSIGSSSDGFTQNSKKRKFEEHLDSKEEDPETLKTSQDQQEKSVGLNGSFPSCSVDTDIIRPVSFESPESAKRFLLPELIHPSQMQNLCSALVVLSEAANFLAESQKICIFGGQEGIAHKRSDIEKLIQTDVGDQDHYASDDSDIPEGRSLTSKRYPVEFKKEVSSFLAAISRMHIPDSGENASANVEKERLILTCLHNHLAKIISFGAQETEASDHPSMLFNPNS